MEIDRRGGGARIGDRHWPNSAPGAISAPAARARNQQGQRDRPAQPVRQDGVGKPEAQEFRAGMLRAGHGRARCAADRSGGRSSPTALSAMRQMSVSASGMLSPNAAATSSRTRATSPVERLTSCRQPLRMPPAGPAAASPGVRKREPVAQFALALAPADQPQHERRRRASARRLRQSPAKGVSARTQASSAARLAPAGTPRQPS